MLDWTIIAAVNDDTVLTRNLLKSPDLVNDPSVLDQRGFTSAALAYNAGIDSTCSEILIFPHQDVYLPKGWLEKLRCWISRLTNKDPAWGVIGVYGLNEFGYGTGHVYSSGLSSTLGRIFEEPVQVSVLDELLLILRRSSGLKFDERLPGFHLYGTDICLEARRRGMKSYVISNFCIHNSNGLRVLPLSYWRSYRYMQKKWSKVLPIYTPCMKITRPGLPMLKHYLRWWMYGRWRKQIIGKRCANPNALYQIWTCANDAIIATNRMIDPLGQEGVDRL
jgi:hypothetical protein